MRKSPGYYPCEISGLIILATWNIQRANRIEAKLALTDGVDPLLSTSKTIDRIHTFRLRTERSLLKLLNEFRRVKSETPPAKPISELLTSTGCV